MSQPTSAGDETLARITELARQALQAQATLARQSLELGRATLQGDVDRGTTGRAYLDAMSREGARYWREVGALGLDYAGELLTLGTRTAARIISDASTAGARTTGRREPASRTRSPHGDRSQDGPAPTPPAPSDGAARRVPVTLRAPAGETARGTVTVANRHPRARRVVLDASVLRDDAGAVVPIALSVDPESVTIPAGAEHEVQLAVDLTADLVQSGQRYHGTVDVSGGDEATLEVTVEVAG
jgi:hypothetical protein